MQGSNLLFEVMSMLSVRFQPAGAGRIVCAFNPALPVFRPGWKGNVMINGKFVEETLSFGKGMMDVIRWKLGQNPQREEKRRDHFSLKIKQTDEFLRSADDCLVWLGHSSFFIRMGGVSLITDPCFYDLPFTRRLASLPCPADCIKADFVLISHNHRDHFDRRSVKTLIENNPQTRLIVPLGMCKEIKSLTTSFTEAGWYQKVSLSGVEVYFLPARHWARRGLTDYNRSLWGSYMICSDRANIYFGGDTAWGKHFETIAGLFPKIDYALMPIGAYGPRWFMKSSHIDPQEAVKAAGILGCRVLVPMHYGTYDMSDEPCGEPIAWFERLCKSLSRNFLIPDVGESVRLSMSGKV